MANGEYTMRFPDLFERWKGHDLGDHGPHIGSFRPGFYEGLGRQDEPVVWRCIEENYLSKYENFLRVEFEWSAEGLWRIPFPGSAGLGEYRSPADYGMPERLTRRIRAWHGALDRLEPGGENSHFDYDALDEEGLEVAREVKLFLGEDHYVEYWPFREISIKGGGTVELEVPAFIVDLAR